jgi:hypothetical protein
MFSLNNYANVTFFGKKSIEAGTYYKEGKITNNKRKVVLYIAESLDGYIAKEDNDIS